MLEDAAPVSEQHRQTGGAVGQPRQDAEDAAPVSEQHKPTCGAAGQHRQPTQDAEDAAPVSERHQLTGGVVEHPRQAMLDKSTSHITGLATWQEDQCQDIFKKLEASKVSEQTIQTSKGVEEAAPVSEQHRQTGETIEGAAKENDKYMSQPSRFNIGTKWKGRVESEMKGGVKEAKRILENKVRKEKREQKI